MPFWLKNFEKAIDEFIDDVLVSPWRHAEARGRHSVRDAGHEYEIELFAPELDPADIEVEVVDNQLIVRDKHGRLESVFTAPTPIDVDRARARWKDGVLVITLPKRKHRKIPLEKP
jgi:HSP20 family molecular chaperone IbpA